ncbi:MAG: class I tRNA ligase family protein [Candidatus Doudnabacteria bacterium]|nr:class I tRNA ligase family protein [Candidatus Doudnabacteria bacterium]
MPFKPIDPKPNFTKLEEEVLKFWEDNQIFEKSLEQTRDGKPYTFYDGPPFATGVPHYGSILPSVVKDLIPRYQTMRGRFVRRRWGWDCHGLPIEEITERHLGISGKKDIEKLGIKKFNETCRSLVLQYVSEWRKTIRRIARWVDFDNSYKTMDRDYMESVWWAFKQIYDKGLVYEGRKVLLYCPRCETPVSNFEVAMDNSYQEVTEEAVTVKFKVKPSTSAKGLRSGSKLMSEPVEDPTYLLAWTTTPWTLPGNVALAAGKDIEYSIIKVGEENYIVATERIPEVFGTNIKYQISNIKFKGKDLVGLEYEPLFEVDKINKDDKNHKAYKVYAADFVNTEEGTGIVHTAVVYGEDDYNLGLKVGLPVVPLLDEKGKFNDQAPKLVKGEYFKDADKIIKQDLEKRGLLFDRRPHQHAYPHCWRCGTALYYNAIPAWFINVQKIKKDLLKSNEKQMNWYPEHLKHGRYQKSVEAAPDWNISRNRYWGNPIPVWKCEDCGKNTVVGSIKDLGLAKNNFFFSRHGEAEHNANDLISAYPEKKPSNLLPHAKKRIQAAAKRLEESGNKIDLIFASDLIRTKETAEIYGEYFGCEVKTDPRLRELNVGIYNGTSDSEFKKKFPYHQRWDKAPDGGETNQQVLKRMLDFVNETNKKYQGKNILIVSHGDPLWTLQRHFGSELPYPGFAQPFALDVSIADLHRPYIDEVVLVCKHCGGKARRVSEIFDSWIEAGSMPFAEYHYPFDQKAIFESRFPGQFVVEYIPQTRAWFYVMHIMGQILFGKAPFEHILTTGTILAEDGTKMSKSKRNYPDPWLMMEKYGVDALRFYLVNSPVMQAEDLNFSERELSVVYRKNILILWNVYNYFVTYANEAGFEPEPKDLDRDLENVLDRWIVIKTEKLMLEVESGLESYDTVKATRTILAYLDELSTWYVRRSRGRKDLVFFEVLRHCLLVTSRVMAPFTPFISEIIFRNLTRRDIISVHLTDWPKGVKLGKADEKLLADMEEVRSLVETGHSLRKAKQIKVRQPLAKLFYITKSGKSLEVGLVKILADELNVKSIEHKKTGEVDFEWKISAELKQEGLARDLERTVQEMRKNRGLKVGEMVNLSYDTEDEELLAAMQLFDTKKTYIKEVEKVKGIKGEEVEIQNKTINIKI